MIRKGAISCLFLLSAVFIAPVESGAMEPAEAFIIRNVEYQSLDGAAELQIETNDHVNYVIYELEDPYRIVVDPLNPVWCDFEEAIYFDEGLVRSIKFIRGRDIPEGPGSPYYSFDFVTIELKAPLPYNFQEDETAFMLNIGEKAPERDDLKRMDEARMIEEELVQIFTFREEAEIAGIREAMAKDKEAIEKDREAIEKNRETIEKTKETIDKAKEALVKEKKAINVAKDDIHKEKAIIEEEKAKLAEEKELFDASKKKLIKKDKKPLDKKDLIDMLKERPVKDYALDANLEDYSGRMLNLDDCIEIAMANNMTIGIAKDKIRFSKMKINEAFRELFPEFSLMWDETNGTISDAFYKGMKFGFEFKQPISHGGEIMNLWEQSKINMKVAEENLNKEREELIFETTKAYYELAKVVNKYNFQKKLLEDAKADFDMAEKEFGLGLMTEIDFLRLRSSMHNISQILFSHKNNIALATLELKKVMNLDIEAEIEISSQLADKPVDIDRDECVKLAKQFKPQHRINYLNTKVAKLSERIAHAKTFPQIDIFAKYLKAAERLEPFVEPLRHYLDDEHIIGATVSLPFGPHTVDYQKKKTLLAPTVTTFESNTESEVDKLRIGLFDNMGRYSDIKDMSIKYKEALDEFNKSEKDIYSDIDEAFYSFEESKLKIENAQISIELYKKELDAQKVRKDYNEASYEDLVESRNKLFAAMGVYKDALGDYYIAIARINKAIGLGGYYR
ncbi:MAG: TolC family protein [Candidatus Omnitrophota bacterium]